MTTREDILNRAGSWPDRSREYSQERIDSSGYRPDCSGYVTMCLGEPPSAHGGWGGMSTVTLPKVLTQIDPADLQAGDVVGNLGPGTAGDAGHVVLFVRWDNNDPDDNHYWLLEMAGGQPGPIYRKVNYPYDGAGGDWGAWRYNGLNGQGDDDMAIDQATAEALKVAFAAPYDGIHGISGRSWMAQAVEHPITQLRIQVDALRADLKAVAGVVQALSAALKAASSGTPLDTAALLAKIEQVREAVIAETARRDRSELDAARAELVAAQSRIAQLEATAR